MQKAFADWVKVVLLYFVDAKSSALLCGMGNRKLQAYMGNDSSCA